MWSRHPHALNVTVYFAIPLGQSSLIKDVVCFFLFVFFIEGNLEHPGRSKHHKKRDQTVRSVYGDKMRTMRKKLRVVK